MDACFKPSSQMTFATVSSDRTRLSQHVTSNLNDSITLDLGDVTHCDSAGLALLIEAKRLSAKKNKCYRIINMPQIVQALAEFCGVSRLLNNE